MAKTVRLIVLLGLISALVGFVRRNQVEEPPVRGTASWEPLAPAFEAVAQQNWLPPVDGACPPTHPVKAKTSSKIFHVPGGLSYDRTNPDRCYPNPESAEADGFRAAKR